MTSSINHATCQHLVYRLSCEDFEALLTRADNRCEICGASNVRLHIDHDHKIRIGRSAVRGLVCPKCNRHLHRVDAGECEATGTTATFLDRDRLDEPPGLHGPNPMKLRGVRVDDELWDKVKARAEADDDYLSETFRKALTLYVKTKKKEQK